jgi:hydroxyacylglutathione hydrolase
VYCIWRSSCMSSSKIEIVIIFSFETRIWGVPLKGEKGDFVTTFAIIGGGFSGACLTAALLRACGPSTSVVLIERSGVPGLGVAYGTQCSGHLLNVRAQNMSAIADDPQHFLRWARLHYDCSVEPGDYVPRQVYGRYAQSVLQEAREATAATFECKRDDAIAVRKIEGRAEITLRGGEKIVADKVVLALGNFPPADPRFSRPSPRYISNPWSARALDDIDQDGSILLVGSGLTSVDVGISLRARGFKGKIHLLSRHGLLPQPHRAAQPWPAFWSEDSPRTARGLLRLIRSQVARAENENGDWRAVIDSLRPFAQKIWDSLPVQEQRRFLRHLRAYWDVHRHRVAPPIGAMLAAELGEGKMEVHAGRIVEYGEVDDAVEVAYRERHSGEFLTLQVDHVINCTGPDADARRIDDPLLKDLLHHGLVRPDVLSLGLDTGEDGALLDARGEPSDLFYTLGPLRKGNLWETTAVPEIRAQAADLALHLAASAQREIQLQQPLGDFAQIRDGSMYFEQCYLGCLAHASYILISQGEAVIVDPQRDVEMYCKAAEAHGAKISHIFETHLHADFVSGHKELAARTGARIYIGARANAAFPHVAAHDGFELRVGAMRLQVLETPGHTPESICLIVTDEEKSPKPWAILTGDTLFLGDVGRPDLSKTHTPAQLAGMLYDSLHQKILTLPDDVLVYPAHGAGSLCGRNMRSERSSTIGTERLTNCALQIKNRDEFVEELTSNLPSRPDYFVQDAELNRQGASALSELPELRAISAQELAAELANGANVLDVRPGDAFATSHVPGSINIALSGQFASWAGIVLGLSARPILIADTAEQLSEARMRLARVGIEDVLGYLQDGIKGWMEAGFAAASLKSISVEILHGWQRTTSIHVIDVRRTPEFEAAHIADAFSIPLDGAIGGALPLQHDALFAVHCKSGYRSTIACSLLQRAGFRNVVNVVGGVDAWLEAKLPVVSEEAVEV